MRRSKRRSYSITSIGVSGTELRFSCRRFCPLDRLAYGLAHALIF
jgi:hypothetical protein